MQNRPPLRASHEKSPIKRVCFVTGDGAVSNHNQSYHTLRGPQILLTSANSHARSLWGPFRTDPICPIHVLFYYEILSTVKDPKSPIKHKTAAARSDQICLRNFHPLSLNMID
ncbi:hypothetical protein AVEN_55805-1 [Araneus ventricosus]|uniref:Uncharacterized protein n=1 Tax=Araneus ventricosus TaxID=182803 RepID=A0A4Y2UXL9_ARAVE|nr:hypothetical protein AVEN_55805-1 [Araneus ventricosus]